MGAIRKLAPLDQEDGAYLGVRASVRGFTWRERLDPARAKTAIAISQRHELPELLGRVLAARDIALDEVPVTLDPTIKALLPDPSTLRDMDKAASRLADAIERREAIAIFGDYDVDGACSSALLKRFLQAHGLDARIYIPDRMTEGYGPNPEAIKALAKEGATLIVTVDCGTTSIDPLAVAAPLGVEVIVVDHHQADERLPDVAALVNPNRQDDISGLGHLCAAGVVFMLLVATRASCASAALCRSCGGASICSRCSIWSGWPPYATSFPLTGLNRAYRDQGPAGHAPAPQCRPQGAQRRRRRWRSRQRPITWASCWARVSMRAAASAMPRSVRGCWRSTTKPRPRASRCCSTSSTASARSSRRRCWTRRSRTPIT